MIEHLKHYGLEKVWEEAEDILADFEDFDKYLFLLKEQKSIKNVDRCDPAHPCSLKTLKSLQELTLDVVIHPKKRHSGEVGSAATGHRSMKRRRAVNIRPSILPYMGDTRSQSLEQPEDSARAAERLDTKIESQNEAVVNAALVVFLREFSDLVRGKNAEFTFDRVQMKAEFGEKSNFTSVTDGVFRVSSTHHVLAILEAKKRDRFKKRDLILQQEAAEFVCWVKSREVSPNFLRGQYVFSFHPVMILTLTTLSFLVR